MCEGKFFFFLIIQTYSLSYIYFYLQDYKNIKEKPWKSLEPGISNAWNTMEKASARNVQKAVVKFKETCEEVSYFYLFIFCMY